MSSGSSVFPMGVGSNGTVRSAAPASDRSATSGFGADIGDTSFGQRLAAAEREVEGALRRNERHDDEGGPRSESTGTVDASSESPVTDAAERRSASEGAARATDDARADQEADEEEDETSAAEAAAALAAPVVAPPPLRELNLGSAAFGPASGSRIAAALAVLVASAQRGQGAPSESADPARTPNIDTGAATPPPFTVDGVDGTPSAAPEAAVDALEVVEAAAPTNEAALPESRTETRIDHQTLATTANDGGEFEVQLASESRPNVDLAASNERAARVLEQVRFFVQPGMRHATLELTPANLGRIDVEISVDRGELAAHLRVDAIDTYEALQRHMPELRASLERAGLDVTQLELSFGARGETASQQRGDERAFTNGGGSQQRADARGELREIALALRPNTIAVDRVDTLA